MDNKKVFALVFNSNHYQVLPMEQAKEKKNVKKDFSIIKSDTDYNILIKKKDSLNVNLMLRLMELHHADSY
ncbi:hypothetical protein [Chryseobacterium fistulae]|uniref:Uncharacterized protein n=1 Tax=Chryseobacterium fistulae TaxID=2675058 RepID=A0A6N4Y0D2_9FLAO|nr:hypothetical protein [Chryseobacterium fistulae]CAA7392537.1 hypothetical protein CHRY9393_03258 [Chryseobacterium fistulae]